MVYHRSCSRSRYLPDTAKNGHIGGQNEHGGKSKLKNDLIEVNMQDDINVSVALGSRAQFALTLDDNQPEDLRIRQNGEDDQNDGDGVTRTAQRVFLERIIDGDEALDGHA